MNVRFLAPAWHTMFNKYSYFIFIFIILLYLINCVFKKILSMIWINYLEAERIPLSPYSVKTVGAACSANALIL